MNARWRELETARARLDTCTCACIGTGTDTPRERRIERQMKGTGICIGTGTCFFVRLISHHWCTCWLLRLIDHFNAPRADTTYVTVCLPQLYHEKVSRCSQSPMLL